MGLSALILAVASAETTGVFAPVRLASFQDQTSVRRFVSPFGHTLHSGGDHGESLCAQSLLSSRIGDRDTGPGGVTGSML